jgi:hypothetical protein
MLALLSATASGDFLLLEEAMGMKHTEADTRVLLILRRAHSLKGRVRPSIKATQAAVRVAD